MENKMLTLSECTRNNLCVDCDSKTCLHAGKLIADCPKYHCDREGDFFEHCESCMFLKEFQKKWCENMRGEQNG